MLLQGSHILLISNNRCLSATSWFSNLWLTWTPPVPWKPSAKLSWPFESNILCIVEVSTKSGKDNTSTLSLVTNRVRLKENLPKSTLALKGGGDLWKPSILIVFWVSPLISFIFGVSTAIFSLLVHVELLCWDFAFRRVSTFHTQT